MYPLLERISPRTRKLELFARMHNTHAGYFFLTHTCASCRIFLGLIPIYQQLNHFDNNEIKVLEGFFFCKDLKTSWTI